MKLKYLVLTHRLMKLRILLFSPILKITKSKKLFGIYIGLSFQEKKRSELIHLSEIYKNERFSHFTE